MLGVIKDCGSLRNEGQSKLDTERRCGVTSEPTHVEGPMKQSPAEVAFHMIKVEPDINLENISSFKQQEVDYHSEIKKEGTFYKVMREKEGSESVNDFSGSSTEESQKEDTLSSVCESTRDKITCSYGKKYSQTCDVLNHVKKHSLIIENFDCNSCDRTFTQQQYLIAHQKIHSYAKNECDLCGKYFSSHSHLLRHIEIHNGVKDHKCDTCGKCFHQRYHLLRHVKIHTGVKDHKCNICEKRYSRRDKLLNHQRGHVSFEKGVIKYQNNY